MREIKIKSPYDKIIIRLKKFSITEIESPGAARYLGRVSKQIDDNFIIIPRKSPDDQTKIAMVEGRPLKVKRRVISGTWFEF